jgi:hypothetical protein
MTHFTQLPLKDTSVIPEGPYCYNILSGWKRKPDGTPYYETSMCPYWSLRSDKPNQMNGYCSFLEKGDWQDDGTMLLWDQVKECQINE